MSSHTYASGGEKVHVIFKGDVFVAPDGNCKGTADLGFSKKPASAKQNSPKNNRAGLIKRNLGEGGRI